MCELLPKRPAFVGQRGRCSRECSPCSPTARDTGSNVSDSWRFAPDVPGGTAAALILFLRRPVSVARYEHGCGIGGLSERSRWSSIRWHVVATLPQTRAPWASRASTRQRVVVGKQAVGARRSPRGGGAHRSAIGWLGLAGPRRLHAFAGPATRTVRGVRMLLTDRSIVARIDGIIEPTRYFLLAPSKHACQPPPPKVRSFFLRTLGKFTPRPATVRIKRHRNCSFPARAVIPGGFSQSIHSVFPILGLPNRRTPPPTHAPP